MARPGTPGRINNQKLCQLLVEDGRTQKQAAVDSGASEAAVSKRLKKLRWNLTRHVGLERFREVADRGLDVFAQLHAINRTIREELAWAVDAARQAAGDRKSLQQVIADLAGEIRKKLAFQVDVLGSLHDMRAVADFQQEVLDAIQEPRPKVATGSSTRSLRDELFAGRFSVPTLWGGMRHWRRARSTDGGSTDGRLRIPANPCRRMAAFIAASPCRRSSAARPASTWSPSRPTPRS